MAAHRFCRMARQAGLKTIGIDATGALITRARELHGQGGYINCVAENLPLTDACTDLVAFYLSLIDIPDVKAALTEATRILHPGGRILTSNLSSFITAARDDGWTRHKDGTGFVHFRDYLKEEAHWAEWRGIRIKNWHRPTSFYMRALLDAGLNFVHFDEPPSTDPDPELHARYSHAAYFTLMEWQKPK